MSPTAGVLEQALRGKMVATGQPGYSRQGTVGRIVSAGYCRQGSLAGYSRQTHRSITGEEGSDGGRCCKGQ